MNSACVYILVLNYCSLDDTIACVKAIRDINYSNLKILVIDNNSPDGSGKILSDKIPAHEFLQLPVNVGYAGGNNAGFKKALNDKADYILVVNPDVRLPADAIHVYMEIMSSNINVGAINSIQVGVDGVTIDSAFRTGVLGSLVVDGVSYKNGLLPDVLDVDLLFGAALFLRSSAIRRVGGFDPLYFAYGEEIDLCRRFKLHGYSLVVTCRSPVVHLRTNYDKPLSDFVLFLKLKGYYLSRLKNPKTSFGNELKLTMSDLLSAFRSQAPNAYPFNRHKIKRTIILRSIFWFIFNAHRAWFHKKIEITGNVYL